MEPKSEVKWHSAHQIWRYASPSRIVYCSTNVKDAMAAAKAAKSAPEFAPESATRGRNFSSVSACLTIPK